MPSYPTTGSLLSELWIPALDTSIVTLRLKVFRSDCQGPHFPLLFHSQLTSECNQNRPRSSHPFCGNILLYSTNQNISQTFEPLRFTRIHSDPTSLRRHHHSLRLDLVYNLCSIRLVHVRNHQPTSLSKLPSTFVQLWVRSSCAIVWQLLPFPSHLLHSSLRGRCASTMQVVSRFHKFH